MTTKKPIRKPKRKPAPRKRGSNAQASFKIEKNIDMPSMRRGSLAEKLPLNEMEVGDSIRVDFDEKRWKGYDSMMGSLRNAGYQHRNKFAVRILYDEETPYARMWRVE
jgi:hypothetical protein